MMDWMNGGPSPLDLLTPLASGMQEGRAQANAQADRAERIREAQANESAMKARLGLEEKQQDFQRSMWNSQADMRSAQLDLAKNQASESANNLSNVVQDHSALSDGMGQLDQLAAKNDFKSIINTPPPSFLTPQAAQAFEVHRNQLLQTGAGQAAAMDVNTDLMIKKAAIENQTNQKTQVANIPNIDPLSFYDTDPKTGAQTWNTGRAAAAINTFTVAQERLKAENSASVLAAQTRLQGSMYGTDTRARTQTAIEAKKAATQVLTNLQKQYQQAKNGGLLTPAQDAAYQDQIQKAQQSYQNAGIEGSTIEDNSPAAPVSAPPPWSSLLEGLGVPTSGK